MTTLSAGPAAIGAALVEEMTEFLALFDENLQLVGINRGLFDALEYPAEGLLGISAVDLIAPEHQDRAALMLGIANEQGAMAGIAPFDLVKADGSTLTLQVTGADLHIGDQQILVVIGRPVYESLAIGLVLDRLLANDDLEEVLAPLLDLFAWRLTGAGVAITWSSRGTRYSVSTELPDALAGMGDLDPDGPWSRALRDGEPVLGSVDDLLDAPSRELAAGLGFGEVWVEPLATISDTPDATITVLGPEGGHSPLIHRFGVDEARRYLAVVLRWSEGARRLEVAARTDDLTGLANRRAFFAAMSAVRGGGAILFADLDDFKSVNDRWGHAVGDAVLTEVGRRLTVTVDPGACVARVGGDEFAIILNGATIDEATTAAEQMRVACAAPFDVDGGSLTLGISIGVAHDPVDLSAAGLQAADRAQYADKRRRATDM